MTDEELIEALREAVRGLLVMSESDYPLEAFNWGAAEPTPEFLRGLTGEAADAPVETRAAADIFRAMVSEPGWKNAEQLSGARRFQRLVRLLEENLTELKAYRVGS